MVEIRKSKNLLKKRKEQLSGTPAAQSSSVEKKKRKKAKNPASFEDKQETNKQANSNLKKGLKKREQNVEKSDVLGDCETVGHVERRDCIEIQPTENGPLHGMRKWLSDYHSKRPGFHALQQQIDEFITNFEAREEKARQEREAATAEEGWTLVEHHKGRKKTTDLESGISVGGVASAAVERKRKKQNKDSALSFYRFQRREARRNEILELQQRFEEDKKKIVTLRAARKFRPY